MLGCAGGKGGMIVVGSHAAKTTAQLKTLLVLENVRGKEVNSDLVLEGDAALAGEVGGVAPRRKN